MTDTPARAATSFNVAIFVMIDQGGQMTKDSISVSLAKVLASLGGLAPMRSCTAWSRPGPLNDLRIATATDNVI